MGGPYGGSDNSSGDEEGDNSDEEEQEYDAREATDAPSLSSFDGDTNQHLFDENSEEYSDWEEFESGDENFIEYGDRVVFEKDGEEVAGEIKQVGDDNLFAVETTDGENVTIETWDIVSYQTQTDDLDDLREELREYFQNRGVGQHSDALNEYTNDRKYREFQEHLRSAPEVAEESPMYDQDPDMETVSAILASTDKDTAETIERIQGQAQNSLPREMQVYRGIDVDDEEFMETAETAMENGETISDEGFQSATIDEEVADGFGNVTLNIQTDHGVYVRAASEHAGEDEILLPAGTEYKVQNVDRETNTVDVEATGGFDFNIDADFIRETMEEKDISYGEAVEEVI